MPKQESRNNVVPLRKQNPLVTIAYFAIVRRQNNSTERMISPTRVFCSELFLFIFHCITNCFSILFGHFMMNHI